MPNKLLHIMYSCALNCDLAHWLASWMDVGYSAWVGVTRSWRIFISLADKFDWLFYSSGPYFLLRRIRSQQNFFLSKPCKLLRGLFVNFSLKISLRGRNFSGTSLPRYRENTFGVYSFHEVNLNELLLASTWLHEFETQFLEGIFQAHHKQSCLVSIF